MSEAKFETAQHIIEVNKNIHIFVNELLKRGSEHDHSKLESPEVEIFEEFTKNLSGLTYGTPEYEENLKQIAPALEHHYSVCRHHPAHFKNGINDMNLIDILEMFADWYASTLRTNGGNIRKSIEHNAKRFKIDEQLTKIFENTIEVLDR